MSSMKSCEPWGQFHNQWFTLSVNPIITDQNLNYLLCSYKYNCCLSKCIGTSKPSFLLFNNPDNFVGILYAFASSKLD